MSDNLKRFVYTLGTIFIVVLIANLFITILPWLLLIGIIGYIIIKVKGIIKIKKAEKNNHETQVDDGHVNQNIYTGSTDYNGEIIDVDYEEVDKKNN